MFNFRLVEEDTKTMVWFEGDMDIEVTELMEEEVAPQLFKSKEIQIDFSKVPFVDSSGIGLLITLVTNLQDHGSKVEIINISPDVKIVFDLLQLPEILGLDVLTDFQ
ncbi:STAS domain-containing protein [Paenibacillus agricola]|uniref:STAS domain-containing protein n=1 Tax=Paenibacillus agricola TaxID=2716264 RepID=A0ABX0JL62_9BACL|nr:STAS domain-containing protein [Paenibacillus agricola]NHN35424.1 STAS domain-containing protein [Paenibacillus agricola]